MFIYPAAQICTHSFFWFINPAHNFCIYSQLRHLYCCGWWITEDWNHCEPLDYKYISFHVVWGWSNEQGIRLSAVSARCYWVVCFCSACLASAVSHSDPLFSLVLPLCLCFSAAAAVGHACKWAPGQSNYSAWGQAPHPSFLYTHIYTLVLHSLSRSNVSCIHNVNVFWAKEQNFTDEINTKRRMKYASGNFLDRDLSWNSIPPGVDELHIPFKHELMWLTNIHTHFSCSDIAKPSHPPCIHPSSMQWRHWLGCCVCAGEG